MSIAFLFPGRGSQRPGMLHRLPDTAASATVLAEADWALRRLAPRTGGGAGGAGGAGGDGPDREYADGIVELDSAQALERSPVACHLALLIAGVAGARALIEDEEVRPSYVAGHGTGGYAAAVLAGVLTLEEALRAVRLRGELLHSAESGNEPEGDVAIRLAQHLATVRRRPQTVPYVGGLQGRCLRGDTNAVFDDLAWSAARPVQWTEVTSRLAEAAVDCCVEMPPGRVLTEELTARLPGMLRMRAVSVEEHGIAEAAELARGDRGERALDLEELGPDDRILGWGEQVSGRDPGRDHGHGPGSGPGYGSDPGSGPGSAGVGPGVPGPGPGVPGPAPGGSAPGQSGLA